MRDKQSGTRSRIVASAWKLFYEQGYDATTVEDILRDSGASKGSFYHYFEGKDALLSTLSMLFDEKYVELSGTIDENADAFDTLMMLNRELFAMIEDRVPLDLLSQLYSTQIITLGEKHLLDKNRVYFKLLRQIVSRGQARGELRSDLSCAEIVKAYALCERALLYDWCLVRGEYSLRSYGAEMMPRMLYYLKLQGDETKKQ